MRSSADVYFFTIYLFFPTPACRPNFIHLFSKFCDRIKYIHGENRKNIRSYSALFIFVKNSSQIFKIFQHFEYAPARGVSSSLPVAYGSTTLL